MGFDLERVGFRPIHSNAAIDWPWAVCFREQSEMVSENRTMQGGLKKKMALDPKLDKEVLKMKIASTVLEQVKGAHPEEVYQLVDEGYERLLQGASVTMHIPVLVEGLVRAEERKKYRSH
jgi:hypothetical protein